jgi:hypothetical protein
MIQGGGAQTVSNKWYKLTPDATGSYINGTFSPRASMNVPRLFFGSNVLPSGDVFVLGREFAPPNPDQPAANKQGEIYDPVTDSWVPSLWLARPHCGRHEQRCTEAGSPSMILFGQMPSPTNR